jgi:predicted nucleic acid-binding protein
MTANVFLDTNLWVYLHAKSEPQKQSAVKSLVAEHFETILISTQVLGELYNVLTKKKLTSPETARAIILEMATTFPVTDIDTPKVLSALNVQNKYGYSYWDSLILATALLSDCAIVYSEDMQHKQLIEDKLPIINPLLDV